MAGLSVRSPLFAPYAIARGRIVPENQSAHAAGTLLILETDLLSTVVGEIAQRIAL